MARLDFQGITVVSERGERAPRLARPASGPRWPFGTPSAGLFLGRVASPQSPPPLHPARTMYCNPGQQTRASRPAVRSAKQRRCHGHEDQTGCSEGSLDFCLDNRVHFKVAADTDGVSVQFAAGEQLVDRARARYREGLDLVIDDVVVDTIRVSVQL